jgi:hypothetical protein
MSRFACLLVLITVPEFELYTQIARSAFSGDPVLGDQIGFGVELRFHDTIALAQVFTVDSGLITHMGARVTCDIESLPPCLERATSRPVLREYRGEAATTKAFAKDGTSQEGRGPCWHIPRVQTLRSR